MTLHALLVLGQPVEARPPQLDGEGHGLERHDIPVSLTHSVHENILVHFSLIKSNRRAIAVAARVALLAGAAEPLDRSLRGEIVHT